MTSKTLSEDPCVMIPFRFPSCLTLLCPALLLSAGAVAADEVLVEWRFDDPAGTRLEALESAGSEVHFTNSPEGVTATGDGQLLIRRAADNPVLYYAPLPEETFDEPVWLVLELDSWVPAGETGEGFRLGFSSGTVVANQVVDIRFRRDEEAAFQLSGRAGGGAGIPFAVEQDFPANAEASHQFALYYEPHRHRYAIFAGTPEGEWEQLGAGRTTPDRGTPAYLRMNLWGSYTDSEEEGVLLDRLAIQRHGPAGAPEPEFGFPLISAWSWGIHDPATGEFLASHGEDDLRKIASITKTMCAHVVLGVIREEPALLDEQVTYSALAAGTGGSTSGLEEGESLTVRDALRALMLPSGNDAGNALAEHFNDRFAPPDPEVNVTAAQATRANFVAEMNRQALDIGMENSRFRLPFGDGGGPDDHTSTVSDLVKLAAAAMEDPRFREVVSTKEYTATVHGPDGTTREVTWTNTNQFLGEPGFIGIKTGTTGRAGACLLTAYEEDGRTVYTVVLGSQSRALRYEDTRRILEMYFPAEEE